MDKRTLSALIIISSLIVSGVIIGSAMAQEQEVPVNIQYPIPELGNCQSQEDCKVFCDNSKNTDACLSFAEEYNLMSAEDVTATKKFQDIGMIGPGGCKGTEACEKYCDDTSHLEECITFSQENGLMSDQQLENSQKVLTAIKNGVKPPACNGQQKCDEYCASAEHMEECINFGIEAGILSSQEKENAQKVLVAIKKGVVPPCYGKGCEIYCGNSVHMEECGNFAIAAGILSPEEKEKTQRLLTAIQEGINLPACTGEEECQNYCSQDAHIEECVKFAVAIGDMSEEDAQIAIKTGGKGPNDCQTKEECDAFCNNPDNSEICFNFAKDNGLISEEDQKKIEDSQQKIQESFNTMPAEVLTCLTSSLGVDTVEKMKSGNVMPTQKLGEQIKSCAEQYTPQAPPGQKQGEEGEGGQKPEKSGQPGQPTQPNQPGQPGQEPSQPSPPTKPEKPANAVNPTKCIEDCEYVGNTCVGQAGDEGKVCASEGQYCRTVYCETYGVQGDDRPTQEQYHACNDNVCTPTEKRCNDAVVAKDSACRTKQSECVTQCQKAAKSGKPQQPQQPGQQPTQPTKPSQPSPPSQPNQPGQP